MQVVNDDGLAVPSGAQRTLRIALFTLASALLLPAAYSLYMSITTGVHWLTSSYWQSTMGNWLATTIGVTAGLPVGLWLNSRSEEAQIARVQRESSATRNRQSSRVLATLSTDLSHMVPELEKLQGGLVAQFHFNGGRWSALTAAGEIQSLADVDLIMSLAAAYESLENVNILAVEWLRTLIASNEPSWPGTTGGAQAMLQGLLQEAASDALAAIRPALAKAAAYQDELSRVAEQKTIPQMA
jgi:hypothetical protein